MRERQRHRTHQQRKKVARERHAEEHRNGFSQVRKRQETTRKHRQRTAELRNAAYLERLLEWHR